MIKTLRRAAVKDALVAGQGDINVSQLARVHGVSRATIYRDLRIIEDQIAAENPATGERRAATLIELYRLFNWARDRATGTSPGLTETERVRWLAQANEIARSLAALEGWDAIRRQREQIEYEIHVTYDDRVDPYKR